MPDDLTLGPPAKRPCRCKDKAPLAPAELQQRQLEALGRQLLIVLGQDPDSAEVRDTPRRWAQWWQEFTGYCDPSESTTFDVPAADQLVAVRNVRVWSLCEHHLLPFWCDLTMAYIPRDRVLGLSKFARIAHRHAHRLQLQERLVRDIADELSATMATPDVAVLAEGEHLCMTMRGIRAEARMSSSVIRGAFREDGLARSELLQLTRGRP